MQASNNQEISPKNIFITSIYATLIIGLVTHAFSFTNIIFSHDSIYIYNPDQWKLALGRWSSFLFKPLLNNLELPWLSGCVSLFAIALSVFLFVLLFEIRDKIIIWLVAGLFVTNISFTLLNATYCHDAFTYMFGVLSIIASVFQTYKVFYKKEINRKYKNIYTNTIFAIILLSVGIGFYQAYLPFYTGCIILLCIKKLLTTYEENIKKILLFTCYAFFIVIAAGILYKAILSLCLYIFNVSLANEYNGITNVFNFSFSNQSIKNLLKNCFEMPLKPILSKQFVFYRIMFYLICFCTFIVNIIIFLEKRKKIIPILMAELMFPFGLNFVYILSKGLMHNLMTYQYMLFLLLSIVLLETTINTVNNGANDEQHIYSTSFYLSLRNTLLSNIRKILILCIVGLIGSQVSFANSVYLKKKLEYQNTYSACNRIIQQIEDIEQYQYNKTKIVFIGYLEQSKIGKPIIGFEKFYDYTGLSASTAVTYNQTLSAFFYNNMNYHFNMIVAGEINMLPVEYAHLKSKIEKMKAFPEKNYVEYMKDEDVIVVKLAE